MSPFALAFLTSLRGPFVDGGFATSGAGDALMFEAGANYVGARSQDHRRWLLQYDLAGAFKFGLLGNQHPFLFLMGPHLSAWAELGRRFANDKEWSPYAGVRLGSDMQILEHPGLAADALSTVNESQAGVRANGVARIDGGVSFLGDSGNGLLFVGFVQEAFQSRGVNSPVFAFTQLGLAFRFDVPRAIMWEVEGAWGVTPNRTNSALGFVDQTTRASIATNVRVMFGLGFWAGLKILAARDTDTITYPTRTYGTGDAPVFDASLHIGWSPR